MIVAASRPIRLESTDQMTIDEKPIGAMSARMLHAVRRRWVHARLRRLPAPSTILFVCRGNLCRSPYAAAVFAALVDHGEPLVESAGFLRTTRPAPPLAQRVARKRGADLSGHRSTSLTRAHVARASLIVVMEPSQARLLRLCFGALRAPVVVLGDLDPAAATQRDIQDPMDRSESVFDASFERIDRCVRALASALTREPADDC